MGGLQPAALGCDGHTASHLKSYSNEPGTIETIERSNCFKGSLSKKLRSFSPRWYQGQLPSLSASTQAYSLGCKQEEIEKQTGDKKSDEGGEEAYPSAIKEGIECEELKNGQKQVKNLWVIFRDQGNNGNLVVDDIMKQNLVHKAFPLDGG